MNTTALLLLSLVALTSCKMRKSYDSFEVKEYREKYPQAAIDNAGQVNFTLDPLGSLNLSGLFSVNIMPIKVYGTALILIEEERQKKELSGKDVPEIMQKFGFIRPQRIGNWARDLSPEPKLKVLGFVSTQITKKVAKKEYSLEVANITCAACHSSVTYDSSGNPTQTAWLGAGNSSLDLDGFLTQVYEGLKKGMNDPKAFMDKIRRSYPELASSEDRAIRTIIFPAIKKSLKDLRKMDRVLPFINGGPGHTNGIGAFKRHAKLYANPSKFQAGESGIVGLPSIMNRGFRSSLTVDGAYGVPGKKRFQSITEKEATEPEHLDELAQMAAFFSYSAMGNHMDNITENIPKVKSIFSGFIKDLKPHAYPQAIDAQKATRGEQIFKKDCASCHGSYTDGIQNVKLVSFPNKFVPQQEMGSDPYRWNNVDESIAIFSRQNAIGRFVDPGFFMGGYVAPLLSGIWFKGSYLHNGSVPTLWHLMNPELRPKAFEIGGHALDLKFVGIKGSLNAKGEYVYPSGYRPWSRSKIFDTRVLGGSNTGHEKEFRHLSPDEKWDLIEYLKLL